MKNQGLVQDRKYGIGEFEAAFKILFPFQASWFSATALNFPPASKAEDTMKPRLPWITHFQRACTTGEIQRFFETVTHNPVNKKEDPEGFKIWKKLKECADRFEKRYDSKELASLTSQAAEAHTRTLKHRVTDLEKGREADKKEYRETLERQDKRHTQAMEDQGKRHTRAMQEQDKKHNARLQIIEERLKKMEEERQRESSPENSM